MRHHGVQVLHLLPERKHARAHAAHNEVEQVEHLLRGPPVLRHAQLDADDLDLQRGARRAAPRIQAPLRGGWHATAQASNRGLQPRRR